MADLDVADVLDDPDFQTSFGLIRSASVVDTTGTNVVTAAPETTTVLGVIQPARARDLDRLPDLARQGGSIQIWTRFPLSLDAPPALSEDGTAVVSPGRQADTILWNGSTYTVMTSDPWLYGSNYWLSLAMLKSLS